jgi:3-oxoacyl-[acyl-carrier-protein] synthase III
VTPLGIVGLGSYLPATVVGVEHFRDPAAPPDPLANSPLFKAPRERRHVGGGERAAAMVAAAARPMFQRLGGAPPVDVLLTNVLLPDALFTGCGAEVAELLGCRPEWIIDLHNGGCASFPHMLKLAQTLVDGGGARTALLAMVQNTAGQIFDQPQVRVRPHAATPGDGCGVAYLQVGVGAEVLGTRLRHTPSTARDLGPDTGGGRRYWEAGDGPLDIWFDPSKQKETLALGNRLVPEVVRELCGDLGVAVSDIDLLVTNQPNRIFLRNWRRELDLPAERHPDTFDRYGNLYGAGMAITLDDAVRAGTVRDGALVVLAGFAHAGDFAGAAAIRWRSGPG